MAAWDDQAEIGGETGGAAPPVLEGGNRRITGGEPPVNCETPTRDAAGHFVAGNAAGVATRFAEGKSGNPAGRPLGSGRRTGALVAAELLDGKAGQITEKAVEMALAGDPVAVRFCLGRILGARRGQPVAVDLPPVARPRDLSGVVSAVLAAIAEGQVTPDEARALSQTLGGLPRVLAAAQADAPRDAAAGEDARRTLARKLARLAARYRDGKDAAAESR